MTQFGSLIMDIWWSVRCSKVFHLASVAILEEYCSSLVWQSQCGVLHMVVSVQEPEQSTSLDYMYAF